MVRAHFGPRNRLGIEMDGGFVEHEQLGLRQQRAHDRHAFAKATRELGHRAFPVLHAEAIEQLPGFVAGVPAVAIDLL